MAIDHCEGLYSARKSSEPFVAVVVPIHQTTNRLGGTEYACFCYRRCMFIVALNAAQALPTAGAKRPAAVPAAYVITPFGYFHPSCVQQLAKGDVLHQDEMAVEHANGTSDKIPACAFPHYRADGNR